VPKAHRSRPQAAHVSDSPAGGGIDQDSPASWRFRQPVVRISPEAGSLGPRRDVFLMHVTTGWRSAPDSAGDPRRESPGPEPSPRSGVGVRRYPSPGRRSTPGAGSGRSRAQGQRRAHR
jgi:hypothetical protein